jgi:hypothetical protein
MKKVDSAIDSALLAYPQAEQIVLVGHSIGGKDSYSFGHVKSSL